MAMGDQKAQGGIPPAPPPPVQIYLMSQGAVVSRALSLAAELGLADLLANGPRDTEQLAQATFTHARSLYRILSVGLRDLT